MVFELMAKKMVKRKETPKIKKNNTIILQNNWYNYYAGYSDSFIIKYLKKYSKDYINPIVLDPWTGSGTTNIVSNYLYLKNVGFDINPAMIIISKAKLYDCSKLNIDNLTKLFSIDVIPKNNSCEANDYLLHWFERSTVHMIRNVEAVIQKSILSFNNIGILKTRNISQISNKTAFYYLLLFKTIKHFSKSLTKSNPSWVKTSNIESKISISEMEFISEFLGFAQQLKTQCTTINDYSSFSLGNSREMCLESEYVDIVLTSPPYCTRIDYAISTIIELSVIGYTNDEIDALRKDMIGTPKILSKDNEYDLEQFVSQKTKAILKRIKAHKAKAAESYYYKTFFQYFENMQSSISEINRVTKRGGVVMMILQDSYFKEIYINLKQCIVETFEHYGFSLVEAKAYKASNNIRSINTNSRKYKDKVKVYERIIVLRKG